MTGVLRIGLDGKYLTPNSTYGSKSGNSVHAKQLLQQLTDLDKDSRYTIYCLGAKPPLPDADNVHCETLSALSASAYIRYGIELPLRLLFNPVDVLISFYVLPPAARCKHLLCLPDISWIVHPDWFPLKLSMAMGLATRVSVRRAGLIAAASHHTKAEIVRHLGVPEDKIVVVPHGIQERFLERMPAASVEAVKAKYGIAGSYILSINDIHPRKNIEGLVAAFIHLNETHDVPHQLVLVGQSLWQHESVLQQALAGKYGKRIIRTGYVPDEDLRPLYQGASVFVYPSFYEGWGLQVHEAMASGVPVAISKRSSLPEVAGDAALQFDPSDSREMGEVIFRILSDSALQADLVRKGHEQIKKFSWQQSARQMLDLCRQL